MTDYADPLTPNSLARMKAKINPRYVPAAPFWDTATIASTASLAVIVLLLIAREFCR